MRNLIIVLLLALTTAKVAAVLARGPVSIELDAWHYWQLSALVMGGDILLLDDPIAYRTPLYPWFLAIARSLSGSAAYITIVVVQGLLWVASIVIAGHIAVRITKLPRAMWLTLLASLPAVSSLTFAAAILSESLFIFLFMLHLLAVLDYAKHGTAGRAVWLGITFAATLLTRPIVLLLWVPHVVFLLYVHYRKRRRLGKNAPGRLKLLGRLGHTAIAALAIGVLIAPWLLRNQHLFGKPFLTEFVGRNVWIVTFQDGSGAGLDLAATEASAKLTQRLANVGLVDDSWRHTWTTSQALVASGLNDPQADRLMKRVAVDAILENQQAFAKKAFRRVVNFWRCAATDLPQQGQADGFYRRQQTWAFEVPPVDWAIKNRWSQSVALNTLLTAVLGCATLFLVFSYPTRPYGIWIALIFCYFSVVTGILEIPAYRYRVVLEPLVAMVFGAVIAVLLSWRRKPAKLQSSAYAKM